MTTNVQYILSLKDMLSAGIERANAATSKLNANMLGLQGQIASTFSIVGIGYFVKSMIDAGTKVEDARVGLTTLLGDAKEAGRVIQNTMDDATKTPFAFEGLLSANKALISTGMNADQARKDILNLANAISSTGGGDAELQRMVVNLQQIRNTGEATALDIKQFSYAGVNIYRILGDAGVKLAKGQSATYEQITMALQKAHEAGGLYYHGLENMGENTSVKISNLGDAVFQLKVKMFNDLKPAIESVVTGLFKLIDHLKNGWNWLQKNKDEVKAFAVGLSTFVVTMRVAVPLMQGFGLATSAALGPIGLMVAGIGLLTGAISMYNSSLQDSINAQNEWAALQGRNETALLEYDMQAYVKRGFSESDAKTRVAKQKKDEYIKSLREINDDITRAEDRYNSLNNLGYGSQAESILETINKKKGDAKAIESKLSAVSAFENKGLVKSGSATNSAAKKGNVRAESTRATGSKSVTINVSIKDIIGTSNINVTNIKEGAEKIKEIVINALTGAVNDFQVTAQ